MHVGINVVSQNLDGKRTDHEVVRDQLRLADLVADLGFDSIWGTEHHFTGYMLAPDVLQYLTYVAGKYPHVQVGSQVVVLPWHNPMRVAEQVSLLDNFCEGRLILGIGRGAAKVEFETFGYDMSESRERFVEYADMLIQGLERGYCEYDGKYLKQKRAEIRPHPFKSFKGRTYAAAVSPDSAPIMAKLGAGLLVIPQKPWDQVADDLELHRQAFREIHGVAAPSPVCGGFVYCHANADRAREDVYKYQVAYWSQVVTHYEYGGSHFGKTKGYEGYQAWANNIQEQGDERLRRSVRRSSAVGNAGRDLGQDHQDPQADRLRHLGAHTLVRRHAARGRGAKPEAVRARSRAGAEEARSRGRGAGSPRRGGGDLDDQAAAVSLAAALKSRTGTPFRIDCPTTDSTTPSSVQSFDRHARRGCRRRAATARSPRAPSRAAGSPRPARISSVTATAHLARGARGSRASPSRRRATPTRAASLGMHVEDAALASRDQRRHVVHPRVVGAQLAPADEQQLVRRPRFAERRRERRRSRRRSARAPRWILRPSRVEHAPREARARAGRGRCRAARPRASRRFSPFDQGRKRSP